MSQISKIGLMVGVMALCLMTSDVHAADPAHALAMHGAPKYGADFKSLDYVYAAAPKGGEIRLATQGTFDSLNPYILKGIPAPAISLIYQTLLEGTKDEALSQYAALADSIETPEDRSYVVFHLNALARWHDGKPVTAEDVVWTFNTLMKDGHPFYRAYYANVKEAVAEDKQTVRFIFDMAGNMELPLIMGDMPVLPKHAWKDKKFGKTSLALPMGSGPYKVASIKPGQRVVYERVKDWWAKDLPIYKGRYNFDKIVYDVYRDESVLLQALFSGNYDLRQENIAKAWHTGYDQKPVKNGSIKKEEIKHEIPAGMQAFVFNTRRAMFNDARVRQALSYAFDFEWSNKQFAFGTYKRTDSYFENSELASSGLPEGRELEILEKYRDQLPKEVFTAAFKNPVTDGSGRGVRRSLSKAKKLLAEAGWIVSKAGVLEKDGAVFEFEFLLRSPTFERWINPFIANLKKLGIKAHVRVVDTAQYQNRMDEFDFDMTTGGFGQSLSPGNEQRDFWGSDKVDLRGSRNTAGVKDPVVDALVDLIVSAPDRQELIHCTRALDRVLLWQYYVIPNWHIDYFRVAYWNKFGRPEISAKYGLGVVDTWWYDAAKADKISGKTNTHNKK